MEKLTVIIITKNEAHNIERCLASVRFADEIVVLDSGSTDGTQAICKQFTDRVIDTDWPGFGLQKQRALEAATHSWVFSIDADEVVSDALHEEIQTILKAPQADAYCVKRLLVFNEKVIKYGPGENHIVRLFKKEKARFTEDRVHETVIVDGEVKPLQHTLWHYSYRNVEELIARMNQYTTLSALQKFERDKRAGVFSAISHGLWMFIRMYFLKRGFLDGKEGFTLAVIFAENSFYRYLKLSYMT